jgi:hypothetical protein
VGHILLRSRPLLLFLLFLLLLFGNILEDVPV